MTSKSSPHAVEISYHGGGSEVAEEVQNALVSVPDLSISGPSERVAEAATLGPGSVVITVVAVRCGAAVLSALLSELESYFLSSVEQEEKDAECKLVIERGATKEPRRVFPISLKHTKRMAIRVVFKAIREFVSL